jgi:predicted ATP-binding protein involved in virulence
MIGWVGTLLQRMYEIYPDSENPQKEAALVLVDEIDAHLHPAWQRALVGLVNKHFSNVQIIATTHSPLVIVGLEPSSVLVARRAPGESEIEIARASDEIDFEGMRADQLLTSPLFGLTTTRGEREQQQIQRYSELLGLKRSDKEQRELEVLRGKMSDWMLDGETEIERAVTRMVLNMDENDLIPDPKVEATLSPEARARVEDGIARLMGEEDGQA